MHLLHIASLTSDQINDIFLLADKLEEEQPNDLFNQKTFLLFFPQTSLRTRVTFEKGIKELGGNFILFPPESLDTQEQPDDVVQYMANWADAMIVRHASDAKLFELAWGSSIPIINAMTSRNHPCEVLADLYAIRQLRPRYETLTYTFVGPASNIAQSWSEIAKVMNLSLHHVCTEGLALEETKANGTFHTDLDAILPQTDVILTDGLPDRYGTETYLKQYQITLERLRRAKKDVLFNPCPPFQRGKEMSEDAIASPYFVGYGFKKHLLRVQQAILSYCLTTETKPLRFHN